MRALVIGATVVAVTGCGGKSATPPVVSISPSGSLQLNVGQTQQLTATADFANPVFIWTSSASAVANVDSASGLVSAVAPGTAVITATTQHAGAEGSGTVSLGVLPAGAPGAPPDGTVYFGFTIRTWDALHDPAYGDQRPFATRYRDAIDNDLGGKTPTLFGVPAIWQEEDGSLNTFATIRSQIDLYARQVSDASVPYVTWNAQTGWDNGAPTYSGITTRTIAAGSLDGYIEQFAKDVRAYGRPLFIKSICYEVNGNSNRNCSPRANPTLSKSDFIAAWRHVVDIFNRVGATNVGWIWNVNTFPRPPADWGIDQDIASYYPGDDVVTWVGVDHYDFGDPANADTDPRTPGLWLDPHYQFAVAHGKPIFLPEWGVRIGGSVLTPVQQNQWLNAMFDYFEGHAQIKAIAYFNYSMINDATWNNPPCPGGLAYLFGGLVNYCPNRNDSDHRLLADSGAGFSATFSARIASSRYSSQLRQ